MMNVLSIGRDYLGTFNYATLMLRKSSLSGGLRSRLRLTLGLGNLQRLSL
jgi:hypothetical protein